MRFLPLLVILSSLSCVSNPQRRSPNNAGDASLNLKSLEELIETNKTETIADTLKILATQYNNHMKHRALVYRSESRQRANFREPRVIVYGKDAKFIFTFNGGNHQRAGDALETMVFNDLTKHFEFREILFKKEMKRKSHYSRDEIELETDRIIVAKPNHYTCLECHGLTQTGPIWANSFLWPGVYGSNDDILFGSFKKRSYTRHGGYHYLKDLDYPRSQGRWIELGPKTLDSELNGYFDYLSFAPEHPRYKHLPRMSYENGFRQFAKGVALEKIDDEDAINAESAELQVDEIDRPNQQLTNLLLKLTWQNILNDIDKYPGLEQKLKSLKDITIRYYPFYWGSSRAVYFEKIPEEMNTPGQFNFYQSVLKNEILLQAKKIEEMEKDFGGEIIIHPRWKILHGENDVLDPVIKKYSALLGRKLTRTEIIGLEGEAGALPEYAQLGWILKTSGIELSDYDINRERKINFHYSTPTYREVLKRFTEH